MTGALSVLHVVATDGHRGAEVFASDLVGALADAGVQQRVAILRRSGRAGPAYPTDVVGVGTDGGRSVLGLNPGAVLRLRRVLHSDPVSIVQAHGGEALKHVLAATIAGPRNPVVYRRIGTAPARIVTGVRRRAHSMLMRRASHVVAVSEAVRREAIDIFGLPADGVDTIPNAVQPERLRPSMSRAEARRSLGIPHNAVVVLSLGALSWEKDPIGAARITHPVLEARSDVMHLFAGDGPLGPVLDRHVSRHGPKGRVLVTPSRNDVGNLLLASDLLLLASRADGMEGMPATVIEAGLASVPVAAYGVAGVPEVVIDGETGVVCRPADHDSLTRAVAALVGDPELRQSLGTAAAVRCQTNFTIASVAPAYQQLYERLTASTSLSPQGPARSSPDAPAEAT